ncbi:MAG TPA: hypothetical protein VK811_02270, partial [Candidatus Acidoferrum sp.]|nr:hypothetical protein [Candidatus Acidoferrum sp.]
MKTEKQIEDSGMETDQTIMESNYNRRRFLRDTVLAVGIGQFGIASLARAQSDEPEKADSREPEVIRPFHINIPDEDLADLRRRILATRWPDRETVT